MRTTTTGFASLFSMPLGASRLENVGESNRRVGLLLTIATLLLAIVLGLESPALQRRTGAKGLTAFENHQLEEVRYLLWLDETRRSGALQR